MPKTIEIRGIDDNIYAALARRAAEAGITISELLRRAATRLAAGTTADEWLVRTRRPSSGITRAEILEAFDELRGPSPD
jgi:hypothetical protein